MKRSRDLDQIWLWRNRTSIATCFGIFVAGVLVGIGGQRGLARSSATEAAGVRPEIRTVLTAHETIVGEPIVYPEAKPAVITARELILLPGQSLPWHRHPMPTFGYVIEGEIEVDYESKGRRTFRAGEALMEAQAHPHAGRNTTDRPVRVLAVSIGRQGQPLSVLAPAGTETGP